MTHAVTEPKITKQTGSEVCGSNGNPCQGGNFICFCLCFWCFVPMIALCK